MTNFDFRHLDQHISTSPEQRKQICAVLKHRHVRKGQTLMLDEDDLIYISEGLLVKINTESDAIDHFIAERDIAIYPARNSPYALQAQENTTIYYIQHDDVVHILSKSNNLNLIRSYHKLLLYWAYQRLARAKLLLLPAREAKKIFYKRYKHIALRLQSKSIASYLNMDPSYFSKL
ncbi:MULTISPECIES: hypothetical protein [Sphingobacterium]|uniref:hypothetical protein n=1 Tax=Sphingobacterium TaxID=28453 RepID=UPI0013DA1E02|nr:MULTISPECIES: hypothetical protein [unclassified Sphingobacterium]